VAKAIEQAHKVAAWVVTYDGIADLQLLRNNDISVIRFVTRPGSSHNLIVSTKQSSKTLRARLIEQIDPILGGASMDLDRLADTYITEAARISGRVVLRAARLEKNALELLGLILTKQVIADSLPKNMTPVAWLLLDDFADWLGHRGKRADILVLCVGTESGKPTVDLIVVESKFVNYAGQAQEAKSSLEQTKASTNDLRDRVILDRDRLNRATWRARVADLLLEHGSFPDEVAGIAPKQWARLIRADEANVRIRGTSLVFVHDCTDSKPPELPAESAEQRQYVFDRAEIARALRRMAGEAAATPVTVDLPRATGSKADADVISTGVPPEEASTSMLDKPSSGETCTPDAKDEPRLEPPEPISAKPEKAKSGGYPESVVQFINARHGSDDDKSTREWLEQTKMRLRIALRGYGLDADIMGDRLTPNSALIRFRGSDRMTVSEVEKRKEVLYTSHQLDVMGVRPGSGEVGHGRAPATGEVDSA
jgi:S-DNA-T family DNA segregation ATPase FtsK/SpoIIIE